MGLIQPFTGSYALTQGFGPTDYELEPAGNGYPHFHNGLDYALPMNTQLYAAGSGIVTKAGKDTTGFGNRIEIDIGNGLSILYGHLESIGVTVGQRVTAGQKIGLSGRSGNSSGPHLHFSLLKDGQFIQPTPFVGEPMGPVATPGGGGLWGDITGAFGSVVNGVTSIPGTIVGTAGGVAGGAVDTVGKVGGAITDLPGAIASGITNGFVGAVNAIGSTIAAGAGNVWAAIRKYVFIAALLLVGLVIVAALVKGE